MLPFLKVTCSQDYLECPFKANIAIESSFLGFVLHKPIIIIIIIITVYTEQKLTFDVFLEGLAACVLSVG